MTEHLNYCRQVVKQFSAEVKVPFAPPGVTQFKSHCIDLARASQKFILPDGGMLYDDPAYRALDDSTPLSLPYPTIAIEFTRSPEFVGGRAHQVAGNWQPPKSLLFARERGDDIVVTVVVWLPSANLWVPYPEVCLPRVGYLDRTSGAGGRALVKLAPAHGGGFRQSPIPGSDYMDEINALLSMLNILQCRNVRVEKSEVSKARKAMHAGKKNALPFDSYHILCLDAPLEADDGAAAGSHRSPREHLRRGHIRRLADGRRIWVNATVVAVGRGGMVSKDYMMRGRK